jgi:hypothetical protein
MSRWINPAVQEQEEKGEGLHGKSVEGRGENDQLFEGKSDTSTF